jgi:3-oxoacyl-[acyl-carrier-protein] synthase-3
MFKIRGSGKYLPQTVVTGGELDERLGLKPGTTESISGVKQRHFVSAEESNSSMGAEAIRAALQASGLQYSDLDAIVCASGTREQSLPCTAALIQKALMGEDSGTPCFDIDSTCLSFLVGLDLVSALLTVERYRRVALVSSEIASAGLDWSHLESASLFGDGAVAFILEASEGGETTSQMLSTHMETYSSGIDYCRVAGGGTRLHPRKIEYESGQHEKLFLFQMDGRKVFKMAAEMIGKFTDKMLAPIQMRLGDFNLVVPHQASLSGMELMRRRLSIKNERWMSIIEKHGNMISASIPLGLHYALEEGRVKRGDRVLLIGTSAGLSIGGVALEI